jgi:hypothetical protein
MNIEKAPKYSASDIRGSSNISRSSSRAKKGPIQARPKTGVISMREGEWPRLYTADGISEWFVSADVRLEFYQYGEEPEIRVKIFPFNKMEMIRDLSVDEFLAMAPEGT